MRRSHWLTCWLAGGFVLSGLMFDVRAADKIDPTGTYTWERTRRNSDEKITSTLTLKVEGNKITGTIAGRGEPTRIENARLEGDTISFETTRVRGDRRFTIKYKGKVSATGIKFQTEFGGGDRARTREFEARKAVALADVLGLWKFKIERPNGEPLQTSLKITKSGDQLKGLYTGPRRENEVKKLELAGDVFSFEIGGETDNGGEWHVVYKGKVSGDLYKGKAAYRFGDREGTLDFVGQREARKTLEVEQILGTWTLASARDNGETRESKLVLSQEGEKLKAVYSGRRGDREAKKVELKGDTLTIDLSWESDNGNFVMIYTGKITGDKIAGKMSFKFGDREGTRDFTGTLERRR